MRKRWVLYTYCIINRLNVIDTSYLIGHRPIYKQFTTTDVGLAPLSIRQYARAHHITWQHFVYQVLSSKVPGYLARRYSSRSESSARSLSSSSGRKCSVTRVHSRFGDRCFAAAGPRTWNNLPASLRDKEVSCTEFRKQLKTFMFQMDCGALWLFWLLHLINTLTYLLTFITHLHIWSRVLTAYSTECWTHSKWHQCKKHLSLAQTEGTASVRIRLNERQTFKLRRRPHRPWCWMATPSPLQVSTLPAWPASKL